jgi:hypothetical protein
MDSQFTKAQHGRAGGFWCICTKWGESMRNLRRLLLLAALILGVTVAGATPASADMTHLSGTAAFDPGGLCPPPVAPFDSYPALVMSGSLEGCWYTQVLTAKDNGAPSGIYLETGRELFIGTLTSTGQPLTFTTTYKFESKWDPDVSSLVEVKGRCQHPIVAGVLGSAPVTGRVDFRDVVENGTFVYRGHVKV